MARVSDIEKISTISDEEAGETNATADASVSEDDIAENLGLTAE